MKEICLVAIVKAEETFLDEWLVYHKMIGIDHFFIYDDDDKSRLKAVLSPHARYVTFIPWATLINDSEDVTNQIAAYRHATIHHIKQFKWVIFLDVDEFVVLRKHDNLKQFLNQFRYASAVSLNWHIFGHNGYFNDPKGLITNSLIRRMEKPSIQVKTFSKTAEIADIVYPHYCTLANGNWVDANGINFSEELYENRTHIAHINHYQCRSFTNWMKRKTRGDVNFNLKNAPAAHLWRLDEDRLLRTFVESVARNKNEYSDLFMQKYKFKIAQKINALKKTPNICKVTEIDNEISLIIKAKVSLISDVLTKHSPAVKAMNSIKYLRPVILFCIHCQSQYGKSPKRFAKKILSDMGYKLDLQSDFSYEIGLAGFGTLVEYMVEKSLLTVDTDKYLEDIDDLLNYNLIKGKVSSIALSNGVAGIGKYFIARANNRLNDAYGPRKRRNVEIINEILDLMKSPFDTYVDLLGAIEFLTEGFKYFKDLSKARTYLKYALEKMETMLREDIYFSKVSVSDFLFHYMAVLIKKAKVLLNDKIDNHTIDFFESPRFLETLFQTDYQKSDFGASFRWSTDNQLSKLYKLKNLNRERLSYLNNVLLGIDIHIATLNNITNINNEQHPLLSELSELGLILISSVEDSDSEWVKLLY